MITTSPPEHVAVVEPARASKRIWLVGELSVRAALLALAIYVLPHVFTGDVHHFYDQARHYSLTRLDRAPYRYIPRGQQGYEFPPFTLVFLALQRAAWHSEAVYTWLFGGVMALLELGSLVLLRRAWPALRRRIDVLWYLSVVPLALLGWFRYDFAAVFFTTVALVGLETGRRGRVGAVIAGFGMKLWPAVLIPCLVARRLWRDAALAGVGCVALLVAWRAFSPQGFSRFLQYRKGSGLEIESVPASIRLFGHHGRIVSRSGARVIDAGHLGWISTGLTVLLVVFAIALVAWALRHPDVDVVAMGGALTIATFLFSRIISAQYLVWAAPFLVVLWAKGNRRVGYLSMAVTACTVTYLMFFDRELIHGNHLVAVPLLVRNLLLAALLVEVTRAMDGRRHGEVGPTL